MAILEQTVDATYEKMLEKLRGVVPNFELRIKADLVQKINRVKAERNAVILGHNYMEPALFHTVPDHVGDSLELCRVATRTTADTIVFCGVQFMAETAKILNPEKTVLIPSDEAGCSLAESITASDVRSLRDAFPGVPIICYINTYADVKAECDACCTSSNAAAVVESFDADSVIFLPDEYLASNVAKETGKRILFPEQCKSGHGENGRLGQADAHDQTIIGWHGKCEVHERFTVEDVQNVRKQFPEVLVLAHPECSPEVVGVSDFSGSTSALIRRVRESDAEQYLLLTECCMGDNIAAENPEKDMLRLCSVRCPHMNQITLEDTLASLEQGRYEVTVPEDILLRARRSIDRMLAVQ